MEKFSNLAIETAVANSSGAMETDTISKNGRSSKSLTSRGNFLTTWTKGVIITILFVLIPFSYGISNDNKVIINIGGAKFLGGPYTYGMDNSPSWGLNVNAGVKTKFFENGVYYGYSQLRKFQVLSREGNSITYSKRLTYSDEMAGFNTFGAYSNFYITSLFKKKDFSTRIFNFYTTVKTGLYFAPAKDTDFTGAGFHCYMGFGAVFYPFKRIGILGEIGGDYFSYMDCELNRLSFRTGISIRM